MTHGTQTISEIEETSTGISRATRPARLLVRLAQPAHDSFQLELETPVSSSVPDFYGLGSQMVCVRWMNYRSILDCVTSFT